MAEKSVVTSSFDSEMTSDDRGITMLDVLEEEQELEDDANAVLGGSDDQNCTYGQGYVKRQALYACGTCITLGKETSAGICLACSYACHEGHNLYELYTKRNFRCDCGNSKFSSNPCRLWKNKASLNEENSYNANFQGKYCTCARPYPDTEDDTPDEMIQCLMCEDWFHGRHLGGSVPDGQDYSEMICSSCMNKTSFLWRYQPSSEEEVQIEDIQGSHCNGNTEKTLVNTTGDTPSSSCVSSLGSELSDSRSLKKVDSGVSSQTEHCLMDSLPNTGDRSGPTFWPNGWRKKLCRCPLCMAKYVSGKCEFLLEEEDTVHAYEEHGKARSSGQSQYDKGMSALGSLDRVKQVEAIHEYNNMKSELKEYLKKFADSKKVVREEDIHEFFSNMQAKKRQRTNEYQIPHFCR